MKGIGFLAVLMMLLSLNIIDIAVEDEDMATVIVGICGTLVSFYIVITILLY